MKLNNTSSQIVLLKEYLDVIKNLKNYSKAEEIFKRAIKITENLLGGDHYNLIKLFFNLDKTTILSFAASRASPAFI